jgi:cellulose synthase/poly-beta-1,6-N-acetylglucosamine synthase-like glycosyltransferase
LPVFLRGTGMALSTDLLEQVPWEARGITEDAEYSARLVSRGIRVRFLPGVYVRSAAPSTVRQLEIQRSRWAGGNATVGREHAARWFWAGLRRRDPFLLDAALTFLVLSRPLVLLVVGSAVVLSACAYWAAPSALTTLGLGLSLLSSLLLTCYLTAGVLRFGLTRRRWALLIRSPAVVGRLIWIALRSIVRRSPGSWIRTPRS